MDEKRIVLVRMDPKARGKEKTRRKEPQRARCGRFVKHAHAEKTRKVVTMGIVLGEGHSKEFW